MKFSGLVKKCMLNTLENVFFFKSILIRFYFNNKIIGNLK